MSQNQNLDVMWQYHSGTKHSYLGVRTQPHFLDWNNKPLLFKIYPTLEVTRLARDFRETGVPALSAIAAPVLSTQGEAVPDLEAWPSSCSFLPESLAAGNTSKEKLSFGLRPVPGRSTKSNSILHVRN